MKLNVVKIQRFSTHDGPGVRTVVFTKGCPLHCEWCHNPETQSAAPQIFFHMNSCIGCKLCQSVCPNDVHTFDDQGEHIFDPQQCIGCFKCADICPTGSIESIGKEMTIDEILSVVLRDIDFYGDSGGITISGGEPMFRPDACIALLSAAKGRGISTAIETSGYFSKEYIKPLSTVTDYFLWDFKDGLSERHKQYTRVDNVAIINNLLAMDEVAKDIFLRCIMIKGVNMDSYHINSIVDVYHKLKHCTGVELIPYHAYGGSKSKQLGLYDNGRSEWIPSQEEITNVQQILIENGCKIITG